MPATSSVPLVAARVSAGAFSRRRPRPHGRGYDRPPRSQVALGNAPAPREVVLRALLPNRSGAVQLPHQVRSQVQLGERGERARFGKVSVFGVAAAVPAAGSLVSRTETGVASSPRPAARRAAAYLGSALFPVTAVRRTAWPFPRRRPRPHGRGYDLRDSLPLQRFHLVRAVKKAVPRLPQQPQVAPPDRPPSPAPDASCSPRPCSIDSIIATRPASAMSIASARDFGRTRTRSPLAQYPRPSRSPSSPASTD